MSFQGIGGEVESSCQRQCQCNVLADPETSAHLSTPTRRSADTPLRRHASTPPVSADPGKLFGLQVELQIVQFPVNG